MILERQQITEVILIKIVLRTQDHFPHFRCSIQCMWTAACAALFICVCVFNRHYWQYYNRTEAGGGCDRWWDQWWTCTKESWCRIRNGEQTLFSFSFSFFFSALLALFWDRSQSTSADIFFTSAVCTVSSQTLWLCGWGVPPSGFLSSHNLSAVHYTFQSIESKQKTILILFFACIYLAFVLVPNLFCHDSTQMSWSTFHCHDLKKQKTGC